MSQTGSSRSPIFVVGVPRSGTTLLASLLTSHSRLAGGPETAFFASLAAAGGERAVIGDSWPDSGVGFLETAALEGESLLERYHLEAGPLAERLAKVEPSASALLAALGESAAAAAGKPRWLEKSPVHLQYLREIRRHFPGSPVVRIVRDPRDVALSLTRVPWGPGELTAGLLYWRRFHERSREFFETDESCTTVRFEELVRNPEATLRRICAFLGEAFEPEILSGPRPTESLVRGGESWKSNAGDSVDGSRAERWRTLDPSARRRADAVAGDLLQELGYPLDGAPADRGWVWLLPRHEAASGDPRLERELESGARLWPSSPGEAPRAGLLVGDPDADDWLGRRSSERLAAVAGVLRRVLGLRLRGKPVYWSRSRAAGEAPRGRSSGLLSLALGPLTVDGSRDS